MLSLSVIIKIFQALYVFPIQCFMVEETTFLNSASAMFKKWKIYAMLLKLALRHFRSSFNRLMMNLYMQKGWNLMTVLLHSSSVHKKQCSFSSHATFFLPPSLLPSISLFLSWIICSFLFKTLVYRKFTLHDLGWARWGNKQSNSKSTVMVIRN